GGEVPLIRPVIGVLADELLAEGHGPADELEAAVALAGGGDQQAEVIASSGEVVAVFGLAGVVAGELFLDRQGLAEKRGRLISRTDLMDDVGQPPVTQRQLRAQSRVV